MTDRPIIFSGPMVRALLDGRKCQTRRVLKPQPSVAPNATPFYRPHPHTDPRQWHCCLGEHIHNIQIVPYAPGDRLWVRENWAKVPSSAYRMSDGVVQTQNPSDADMAAIYAAGWDRSIPKWKPSIHMPRWASRLTLVVADVRVQRVQEISEADAIAEGLTPHSIDHWDEAAKVRVAPVTCLWEHVIKKRGRDSSAWQFPTQAFRELWNDLNAERGYGWDVNPWVVGLTFTVEKRNIDA